ncbi:aldo/keto reductase [Methanobrevibacter sp. OttesenSCG-928-K11]|nr:aldo/keto reductase [Methanobrevibacter sp. OttesenSCG-928-K11]MDL2271223.1 aldo/keto reductase [Methanobrevibacter sp. OttesenSCG-928-I08]
MNKYFKKIPKLGFGLMRLPMIGEEIDIAQTQEMVDLFIKKGFTYFDTAYLYHNQKSEEVIKKTLVDKYSRDKFQLSSKLPAWMAKSGKEAKNMFKTSLKRTGVDYFDFYLLHNLGENRTEAFDNYDIWNYLLEKKEEGFIKHLGFSSHAKAVELDEILRKHPEMDFVQLQINYADWESDAIQSRKCYEVARAHKKPIIIMEPVKGGALVKLPKQVEKIFTNAEPNQSLPSWALRYAASFDNVITVLSGMGTINQMRENISIMENFKPLNSEEIETIEKARDELKKIPQIPCTDCDYCLEECPKNVAISNIFRVNNDYLVYNDIYMAKGKYYWETLNVGKASDCDECGNCEKICPQNIQIITELKKSAKLLE